MFLKSNLSHLILFSFCVYLKCAFTLDVPPDHLAGKGATKDENIESSTVHTDPVDAFKVNKKSDLVIKIPLDKPANRGSNKGTSQLIIEGGGVVDLTSTPQPNESLLEKETANGGTNHSKGSKPRKGVQHLGSSVVPRKGVDSLGTLNFNQSSDGVTSDPIKESTNAIVDSQRPSNKPDPQNNKPDPQPLPENSTPKVHHKKPVEVTDIEDVDDFEKYPIIQTSTTGEDYIIIGIVIVLGIWCSIFGALIFYRRAGEYWDRRHYRRMDFLVEGMYND